MSLSKPTRHQTIILSILHPLSCTDPLHSGWLPSLPRWTPHTTRFHSTGFLGDLQGSQSNTQEFSTLNIQYTTTKHRWFVASLVELSRVNLGDCYFSWPAQGTRSPSMMDTPVCTPPRHSRFVSAALTTLLFFGLQRCLQVTVYRRALLFMFWNLLH